MPKNSYQAVPTGDKDDAASSANDCASGIPLEDIESPSKYHPYDGSHSISRLIIEDKLQPVLGTAQKDKITYYIHGQLDEDPVFLEQHIRLLASDPPRCWVNLYMTVNRGPLSGQRLLYRINISAYLLYDSAGRDWHHVSAIGAYDWVRRGSFFCGRARDNDDAFTDIGEWCRRFSASSSGLKVISIERRIIGCNWEAISSTLERIIRETGYTGSLEIIREDFNMRSEIHNQCHTNYWRLRAKTPFWYCTSLIFLSLIFLLWQLWLFLCTRYWDTIRADWRVSRVVVSEDGGRKREYVSSKSEMAVCDSLKDDIRAFMAKQQAI